MKNLCLLALFVLLMTPVSSWAAETAGTASATASETVVNAEEDATLPPPKAEGPPLPLHSIEGVGGVVLTEMAYLVNPSVDDNWFGLPSISAGHLQASDKDVEIFSITETLFDRLELGYAFQHVGLGDFPLDVKKNLAANLSSDSVEMHTLSARLLLLNEGAYDQSWLPAITAGVHYKYNDTIDDLNSDLGGALRSPVGVKNNDGYEYTLTATKMVAGVLPRPFFVSGTLRNSDAAQIGWLGFTSHREWLLEGNVGVLVLDNLIVGAEYRQKPDELKQVPKVIGAENDWWSIAASYIVNNNLNITAAYANLGNMMNTREPAALWLQLKYEF